MRRRNTATRRQKGDDDAWTRGLRIDSACCKICPHGLTAAPAVEENDGTAKYGICQLNPHRNNFPHLPFVTAFVHSVRLGSTVPRDRTLLKHRRPQVNLASAKIRPPLGPWGCSRPLESALRLTQATCSVAIALRCAGPPVSWQFGTLPPVFRSPRPGLQARVLRHEQSRTDAYMEAV